MRYILPLLAVVTTGLGCAAGPVLSPEAQRVRVITPAVAIATSCAHLGMVHSFQPVLAGGLPSAQVEVRNKVAKVGGNAVAIASQTSDYQGHGEIVGDAYACKF